MILVGNSKFKLTKVTLNFIVQYIQFLAIRSAAKFLVVPQKELAAIYTRRKHLFTSHTLALYTYTFFLVSKIHKTFPPKKNPREKLRLQVLSDTFIALGDTLGAPLSNAFDQVNELYTTSKHEFRSYVRMYFYEFYEP